MINKVLVIICLVAAFCASQSNTWSKITDKEVGVRYLSALVYAPDSNRFILSMGSFCQRDSNPYSEMAFTRSRGMWYNFLPHDTLYGKWADSSGFAYGRGLSNSATFSSYYFIFKSIDGYLRPSLYQGDASNTYYQYAYDSDDKKIYYYVNNKTFSYNTMTRRWDTLSCAVHPANFQGGTSNLIWSAMCYNPVHQEVLLFGGGGVDVENGNVGTWTFTPATNTWTKLDLAIQPPPRAYSPMVYDPVRQKIILFGGDRLDVLYSDTWVFDCATRTWEQKSPALCPSPRAGHALLYMPKSNKVVLIGGFEYTSSTAYCGGQYRQKSPMEMWTYDVAADEWKLIKRFGTSDLQPNLGAPMSAIAAVDTSDRMLVIGDPAGYANVINAVTYSLDCDASQIDVPGTMTYGVASGTLGRRAGPYDPAWYDSAVGTPNPDSMENLLGNLPENTWTRVTPPRVPRVDRVWGTRVFDPDRDLILVWAGGHSSHGGTDVPQYSPSNNRWHIGFAPEWPLERTYSNTSYPPHYTFQNRPFITGHTYDNYGYDVNLKKLVLVKTKYTYTYDPDRMDWDSLRIPNHAQMGAGFYNTSMTSTRHGVFCWTMDRSYIDQNFFLLDSATRSWRKLPINNGTAVPIYYSEPCGAAYDGKRDQVVLVSGTSDPGKAWIYDFSDSTLVKITPPGAAPVADVVRECVYLPNQDKILYAGEGTHGLFNCETREWESMAAAKGAGVGTTNDNSSGYMYDPKRDLVWDVQINCEVYVMRVSGGAGVVGRRGVLQYAPTAAVPNPFNPDVRILLPENIRNTADWSLRIFSSDGKLTRNLGKSLAWNGKNDAGRSVPSGIYYCVLKTDKAEQVLRLTLLR